MPTSDLEQLRAAMAVVDPASLTSADRAALLDLFERALATKQRGGGRVPCYPRLVVPPSRPDCVGAVH